MLDVKHCIGKGYFLIRMAFDFNSRWYSRYFDCYSLMEDRPRRSIKDISNYSTSCYESNRRKNPTLTLFLANNGYLNVSHFWCVKFLVGRKLSQVWHTHRLSVLWRRHILTTVFIWRIVCTNVPSSQSIIPDWWNIISNMPDVEYTCIIFILLDTTSMLLPF